MSAKRCTWCTRDLPLTSFNVRKSRGIPYSVCKQCQAADCATRRKQQKAAPAPPSDPLNLLLRDMPGFRGGLLGIADAMKEAA